jgi:hypothetical protein
MNEILQAYMQLHARNASLPVMRRGSVEVRATSLGDPAGLWQELARWEPVQGWLMFQSIQLAFHQGLFEPRPEWGQLLACEAVNGDGDGLALLSDGRGGWRLLEFLHRQEGPGLWDEVRQYARTPDNGKLVYRRYWQETPERGFEQQHAVFIGFE